MTVRVGVVGAGFMGADHIDTLHRQVTGAAVTMVADLDLDRARGVAAALTDARATDDGFALIGDPAVDAVVVASADATHADLAVAAVQAGKPVMCEKPLEPTLPECLRVAAPMPSGKVIMALNVAGGAAAKKIAASTMVATVVTA